MTRNIQNKSMKPLMLAMIAIGLTGCAATQEANKTYGESKVQTENTFQGASIKSSASMLSDAKDPMANFGHAPKNWVNPIPLPKMTISEDRARLPALFKKNVSLTMPGRVSLVEVVSEIQRANNIKFEIAQDVYSAAGQGGQGKAITAAGGISGNDKEATPVYVNDFVYRGTLEGALDLIGSKSNTSWKWTGSGIKVFRYETKTYSIAALAGSLKTNTTVSMTGATTAGTGSATTAAEQGVNRTSDVTKWNEIKSYLFSMMSPNGTMAVLESAGVITVNDTPSTHLALAKAVNELNAVISKQIYVNVDVYAINKNTGDNLGVDWNLAWGTANSRFGLGYTNAGNTATTGNFNIGVLRGPFQGTNVILNALSTLGRASVMNQFALTTLNGEPTPVSSNRKIGYVDSVKSTPSTTVGVAPTVEVSQSAVFAGIGLTVTPKVQPDGKILMEYSLNLNDVEEIKNFTTGSGDSAQTIQLPTTTVKSILQRASLRSGQTLVLSGFKQIVAKNNNSGVGSPSNFLLGGKNISSNEEQYLVITITPYLAQDND
jgi:type IVB pilus formation R64 PilN family outer membrane protein